MPRSTKSKRGASTVTAVPYAGTAVGTIEPEPNESENVTVSAATVTATTDEADVRELPFEIDITPAEEGFKPDRSPAGRKRIPSPFEDSTKPYYLPNLKGQGWQNQPHDGNVVPENQEEIDKAVAAGEDPPTAKYNTTSSIRESNARDILREIEKAVKYLNLPHNGDWNIGLDKNITAELVQFNIRDKQDRKPRTAPGGGDVSSSEDEDYDEDSGDE